jgi:Cft2 family RNA processing exonuclease
MMEDGDIGRRRVFVGGLGRVFTEIYDLEAHRTHREYPSLQLHEALDLVVLEPKQIERVGLTGGGVFVLTAGMMSEGSASHDLAARMIGEKAQAIFFVGYADPETPGGRLRAAKHGETFHFSSAAGEMRRLCHIEEFDLTAHANREEMLAFVGEVEPRAVLLTHGEPDSQQWFADQISARYPRMQILRPGPGDAVEV